MSARLDRRYSSIFDDAIRACTQAPIRGTSQRRVTAFWPLVGSLFQPRSSLLVVGRAVNGWLDGSLDLSSECSDEDISHLRRQGQDYAKDPGRFSWLSDNPSTWSNGYNPHRSQFWSVVRRLSARYRSDGPWYESVAWSNLYKIAPYAGGNPGERLCNAQLPFASDLLALELESFQPRAVVFLTGWLWAKDLIPSSVAKDLTSGNDLVEAVGQWSGVPFVVGPHPQGKAIDEVATALSRALEAA